MLLRGRTGDEQVINVCKTKVEATEDFINEPLERLCGIAQPKINGMRTNLKRPNGAVMAVFGMSSGSTGICMVVCPHQIDMRKDIGELWKNHEDVGTGYQFGTVMSLSARKSSQGFQSPGVLLGTMCKGDAQLLEEGRIMPS